MSGIKKCEVCNMSMSDVYGRHHSESECALHSFMKTAHEENLTRLIINDDVSDLINADVVPIKHMKFMFDGVDGYVMVAYAPLWVIEGIKQHVEFGYGGMSLVEYMEVMSG